MAEADIQKQICLHLEKRGHLFWRFSPETYNAKLGIHLKHRFVPNGLPDIMVVDREHYGMLFGLEVKTSKGRPSPGQLLMKKRFELNNARYEFVTSVEDVKALGL
jgi:hypothetical protein